MKVPLAGVVLALLFSTVFLASISVVYGQLYIQEQTINLTKLFEENLTQDGQPVTILYQSPDMIVIKESTTNPQVDFWKSIEILIKNGYEITSIVSVPTELNLGDGSIHTDHIALVTK